MTRDVRFSYLLLLIPCYYFLPSAVAQCRHDWILHGETCYGFGEEAVTWGDADDICRGFGGKLAEIETAEENTFLKNACGTKHGAAYWLGGTDIFHEGVWRWVSTDVQMSSFTDWAHSRPSDTGGQDCLTLYRAFGYQWNDRDCSNAFFFICEAEPLGELVG